jgi:hypothetical protein
MNTVEKPKPTAHKLKGLHVKRTKIVKELDDMHANYEGIKAAIEAMDKKIEAKRLELQEVDAEIEEVRQGGPIVTEHAILRYMERVMGIDLQAVADDIMRPGVVEAIGGLVNAKIPHPDGYRLVVRDRAVVTIEG